MIKTKKVIVVISVSFTILAGFFLLFVFQNKDNSSQSPPKNVDGLIEGEINYEPATDEERKETELYKEKIIEQNTQVSNSVTPVITQIEKLSDSILVRGYIDGVIESGGVCKLTVTSASGQVDKSTEGLINSTNTVCEPFEIMRSEFSAPGEWSFVLSYTSGANQGTSIEEKVIIE